MCFTGITARTLSMITMIDDQGIPLPPKTHAGMVDEFRRYKSCNTCILNSMYIVIPYTIIIRQK